MKRLPASRHQRARRLAAAVAATSTLGAAPLPQAAGATPAAAPVSAAAPASASCASGTSGTLGTSRTLTLPRSAAAYGSMQHGRLPLAANEVVLTFDDGPDPTHTPTVLAALKAQGVRATFFLIGQSMASQPALARALLEQGQIFFIDRESNENYTQLAPAAQQADIAQVTQRYRSVLSQVPAAWRYPYLAETAESRALLAAAGLTVLSADVGIEDWVPAADAAAMAQRLFDQLERRGGGIVLLHDIQRQTAEALPLMLAGLCTRGWKVVHLQWEPAT